MDKVFQPSLPERALSVRQPWAWAIMNAGKDVENRNTRFKFRGRVCIHASANEALAPLLEASRFIEKLHGSKPPLLQLARGGIIGTAEVVDLVSESASPWFFGPYGLVLRDPKPCPFIPVRGALGFFKWRNNL